jgi:hypothetical protein
MSKYLPIAKLSWILLLIGCIQNSVIVPEKVIKPAYIRFSNVSGHVRDSSNTTYSIIKKVFVDEKFIFGEILHYGNEFTKSLEIIPGKHQITMEIENHDFSDPIKTVKIGPKDVILAEGRKYFYILHRTDVDESLVMTLIESNSIPAVNASKLRLGNLYYQRDQGISTVDFFPYPSKDSSCSIPEGIVPQKFILKYGETSAPFEVKAGIYGVHFHSSSDLGYCRTMEVKNGETYSAFVGGFEADGGNTVAVVTD